MSVSNVLMVGVGGQGIVLSSDILSLAALRTGLDVKKSEIHGMSQRGGAVFSHVRFGEKVFSPTVPKGEAQILLALEKLEVLRWKDFAAKDCVVVYLKNEITPSTVKDYPTSVDDEIKALFPDALGLDPSSIKRETNNAKVLNVALLGAASTRLDLPREAWVSAIGELAPKGSADVNLMAFDIGVRELELVG